MLNGFYVPQPLYFRNELEHRHEYDGSNSATTETTNSSALGSSKQRSMRRGIHFPEFNLLPFLYSCFVLSFLGSVLVNWFFKTPNARVSSVNECDNTDPESMTMTERYFQIDISAAGGLSFAQAKMIDLVWDVGFAQGGRLFHGWMLYHLVCRVMTWALQQYSMPYPLLIDLLFWPDSLKSLWSSLRYVGWGKKRVSVLLVMVLLAYSTAHVLFFGALWSSTTGYQSTGDAVFTMYDGSWVGYQNDSLRFCWLLDLQRLERGLPAGEVVLGPPYNTVFQSLFDINSGAGTNQIWGKGKISNILNHSSRDFTDIYACKPSSFIPFLS